MKNMWTVAAVLLALASTSVADAHGRLLNPPPRTNNDGIKLAPCGGFAKGAPRATWTVGQTVTITWEETINHPGRFILSLAQADNGFQQGVINANIPDVNVGALPHQYSYNFTVPNTPGENWTLQWIQSMEENPNNPSYYYSCADIRIVGANGTPAPTPTPGSGNTGGESTQSSTGADFQKPGMASCGLINGYGSGRGGSGGPMGPLTGWLLTLPLVLLMILRNRRRLALD